MNCGILIKSRVDADLQHRASRANGRAAGRAYARPAAAPIPRLGDLRSGATIIQDWRTDAHAAIAMIENQASKSGL